MHYCCVLPPTEDLKNVVLHILQIHRKFDVVFSNLWVQRQEVSVTGVMTVMQDFSLFLYMSHCYQWDSKKLLKHLIEIKSEGI